MLSTDPFCVHKVLDSDLGVQYDGTKWYATYLYLICFILEKTKVENKTEAEIKQAPLLAIKDIQKTLPGGLNSP